VLTRYRRLAGQDGGPALEGVVAGVAAETSDGFDEVQPGAHGAFRIVLADDGRAPDGHHRVADELLDRAAVAADDVARDVEVAGEELAHLFRVGAVAAGGEPDEVGEEDADDPALRLADGAAELRRLGGGQLRRRGRRLVEREARPEDLVQRPLRPGEAQRRERTVGPQGAVRGQHPALGNRFRGTGGQDPARKVADSGARDIGRRSGRERRRGCLAGRRRHGRPGLVEARAALPAEPHRALVREAALRAGARQPRAAVTAELAARFVDGAAGRTGHGAASAGCVAGSGKGSHSGRARRQRGTDVGPTIRAWTSPTPPFPRIA
jgi:hypothetical protein